MSCRLGNNNIFSIIILLLLLLEVSIQLYKIINFTKKIIY
jgi:hypothetical protein